MSMNDRVTDPVAGTGLVVKLFPRISTAVPPSLVGVVAATGPSPSPQPRQAHSAA